MSRKVREEPSSLGWAFETEKYLGTKEEQRGKRSEIDVPK